MNDETRKLLEAHHLTAYQIERQSGYVTEQAVAAALEQARREALEEARKAVCLWCSEDVPVTQVERYGLRWHSIPATSQPEYCHASPIRALMAQEPTP